jgi:hypothetical protein
MEFKIPLRNKDGDIISYGLIDEDIYNQIKDDKWHLTHGYIKGKVGLLHRYIINAEKGQIIDHINNDRLDNRKANLQIATSSQNMQNKTKQQNCTSKYIGVSYREDKDKWRCRITIDKKVKHFSFVKEEHAAWWYNQLALKHYGLNAKINEIEKPVDFIEPFKKEIKDLPIGVTLMPSGSYRALISGIHLGIFETIDQANIEYNKVKEERQYKQLQEKIGFEIKRNHEGLAVIITSNGEEILVDDNKYFDLKKYTWRIINRYAMSNDNKYMHRYLLNAQKDEIVDHINHNTLDNRLLNLRIANVIINNHNRTKQKDTTSSFIGVCFKSGKFVARIKKDKKEYYLGRFQNEIEAAKAYNNKAKELYGEYANLNKFL